MTPPVVRSLSGPAGDHDRHDRDVHVHGRRPGGLDAVLARRRRPGVLHVARHVHGGAAGARDRRHRRAPHVRGHPGQAAPARRGRPDRVGVDGRRPGRSGHDDRGDPARPRSGWTCRRPSPSRATSRLDVRVRARSGRRPPDFEGCAGRRPRTSLELARLEPGKHTILVRAVDPSLNADPTPASHTWAVVGPAMTTILTGPPRERCEHARDERDLHVLGRPAAGHLRLLARRRPTSCRARRP